MVCKLRVLDLFSGIGGFSLGLHMTGGFETAAFVEIDPYCRKVLNKNFPGVPIYEDIKEFDPDAVGLGRIDVITGGYPCQPFSYAGKRDGTADDRHLWPEVKRLVATVRPRWGVFENVSGHITMGLDEVLSDLEGEGYTATTCIIPACAVDAPHRRDRVWIVAHDDRQQRGADQGKPDTRTDGRNNATRVCKAAPLADASRLQQGRGLEQRPERERTGQGGEPEPLANPEVIPERPGLCEDVPAGLRGRETEWEACLWLPEPPVGRVAHGVPNRVDRLKGLGNAVVPQIPEMIGYAILEAEAQQNVGS